MREEEVSGAGGPPRGSALPAFLAVLLALATALTVAELIGHAGTDVDVALALAFGGALALTHASQLIATNRADSFGYGPADAVVAAGVVLAPDQIGPAAAVFALLMIPTVRFAATLERVRRATRDKMVFNVSSRVVALVAAGTAAELLPTGSSPWTVGLTAGLVHFAICTLLAATVVSVASGQRAIDWPAIRTLTAASIVATVVGTALAVVTPAAEQAWVVLSLLGLGLYVIASWNVHHVLRVDAQARLLRLVPALVGADDRVDDVTLRVARELLGTRHATFAPVPAAAGQLSVPIVGRDGREEHLVVWARLGDHQRFDREDRELLEGLARLAGPARQQRQLVDDLRHSEESRAAIVGALAHDLRSPLATAGTGLATAVRFQSELGADRLSQVLASASRGVERALAILDDLLALERAELDPTRVVAADVAAVAAETADALGAPVVVIPGPAISARIDDRILARIVDNLVTNAVKHAPGSEVRIAWSVSHDEVTIRVEDDGAGIPDELREHLTGAFHQGSGAPAGVGLGLYLARRFTELADGRFEIGDSPSGGAAVLVTLPVASVGTTALTG